MSDYMKMINLRNKLDIDFYNILRYDPEFNFYRDEREKYYSFSASTYRDECDYDIRFNFKIYYDDESDLLDKYSKYNSLEEVSDSELQDILTGMKDLSNVYIEGLYITPKKTGLGSKIVNILISRLKEINTINKIYLYPADNMAEKFWSKQGFKDCKEEDDCRYYSWGTMNDWFYKLNK